MPDMGAKKIKLGGYGHRSLPPTLHKPIRFIYPLTQGIKMSHKIIKILGTTGSGKTTKLHELYTQFKADGCTGCLIDLDQMPSIDYNNIVSMLSSYNASYRNPPDIIAIDRIDLIKQVDGFDISAGGAMIDNIEQLCKSFGVGTLMYTAALSIESKNDKPDPSVADDGDILTVIL